MHVFRPIHSLAVLVPPRAADIAAAVGRRALWARLQLVGRVRLARDGVGACVGEQLLVVVVAERLIPAGLAPQAGSGGARTGGVEGGGVAVGDVLLALVAANE